MVDFCTGSILVSIQVNKDKSMFGTSGSRILVRGAHDLKSIRRMASAIFFVTTMTRGRVPPLYPLVESLHI